MPDSLLASMIPFFGCLMERTPEGLRLSGAGRNHLNAAALTSRRFQAPFTLRLVAKTDSTNLRLYWHRVDGRPRFACEGTYGRIDAPLAVGPCFGSTVTVREFAVREG